MSELLHHSDFVDLVDQRFSLSVEGVEEPLEAELIEAVELTSDPAPEVARRPFTLQFKLPPGTNLAQGLVNLRHDRLADVPVFLVPIAADHDGWYMEACFN